MEKTATKNEIDKIVRQYRGILSEVGRRIGKSHTYVRNVIVLQLNPGENVWATFYEVLNEMKGERQENVHERQKYIDKLGDMVIIPPPSNGSDPSSVELFKQWYQLTTELQKRGVKLRMDEMKDLQVEESPASEPSQSCDVPCGPGDYHPGGKCDQHGCYEHKDTGSEALQMRLLRKKVEGFEARLNFFYDLLDESRLNTAFEQFDLMFNTEEQRLSGIEEKINTLFEGMGMRDKTLASLVEHMAAAKQDIKDLADHNEWLTEDRQREYYQLLERLERRLEAATPTLWTRIQSLFK